MNKQKALKNNNKLATHCIEVWKDSYGFINQTPCRGIRYLEHSLAWDDYNNDKTIAVFKIRLKPKKLNKLNYLDNFFDLLNIN